MPNRIHDKLHYIFRGEGANKEFNGGTIPGYLQFNRKKVIIGGADWSTFWTSSRFTLVVVSNPVDVDKDRARLASCLEVIDELDELH